jgi:hypothetical protein
MRGKAARETEAICQINVEAQLRADHPLREVKRMCKEVLKALEPDGCGEGASGHPAGAAADGVDSDVPV